MRPGSARVVKFGRLFKVNTEIDSKVVDDIERTAAESAMLMVPVTAFSPLSVISWIPFAASETFPLNVVHPLSFVMSFALLIARSPEQSV